MGSEEIELKDYEYINIPISKLERSGSINDNDLLLISIPNDGSESSENISKNVKYSTLANNISIDLEIAEIKKSIAEINNDLTGQPEKTTSIGSEDEPYIITSFTENNRGFISNISGIPVISAMDKIFKTNEFDFISAENSPWVLSDNITHDLNDSDTTKVVSQKLAYDLSAEIEKTYIKKNSIVSTLPNNKEDILSDNIASQKLIRDISSHIIDNFINNDKIEISISSIQNEDISTKVASIELVKQLSDIVDENYVKCSSIADTFGDSSELIASQKMISAVLDEVDTNYIQKTISSNYVLISDITNEIGIGNPSLVVSQSLASGLCAEIDNRLPKGIKGEVYFARNDGVQKQTLMDLGVFVCEDDKDISNSLSFPPEPTRNIFSDWEIGGVRDGLWYGYDNNYSTIPSGSSSGIGIWGWVRDKDDKKLLKQLINTSETTFCVTPYTTDKYDITLSVKSDSADNDVFGIIASYVEDENGRPHILSFGRNIGNEINRKKFYCDYDETEIIGCPIDNLTNHWNSFSKGVLIRVIRDGSKFTVITGEPSNSEEPTLKPSDERYRIEIDLSTMVSNHEISSSFDTSQLSVFNEKPGKIGVFNRSQEKTYYKFKEFNTKRILIDARTNEVSSYYNNNGSIEVDPIEDTRGSEYIGIGRFTKNTSTNKTFYVTPTGFIKVSELT